MTDSIQKWPTNKLCGKCGKVNCWNKECCGQGTIELGNRTGIPQKAASKKAWKAFCDEIGVDIFKLEFLKK